MYYIICFFLERLSPIFRLATYDAVYSCAVTRVPSTVVGQCASAVSKVRGGLRMRRNTIGNDTGMEISHPNS